MAGEIPSLSELFKLINLYFDASQTSEIKDIVDIEFKNKMKLYLDQFGGSNINIVAA